MNLIHQWNLDTLFRGGSNSKELVLFLEKIENDMSEMSVYFDKSDDLIEGILFQQDMTQRMSQAHSFIHCLCAQNVHDVKAAQLQSLGTNLEASFATATLRLDQKLAALSDDAFFQLMEDERLKPISFPLQEQRIRTKEKLEIEQEAIISSLAVDGYHGWSQMYDTLAGNMHIPFTWEGNFHSLSVAQAQNKLSDSNRPLRTAIFKTWTETWGKNKDLFARIINHLAGFRLKVYQHREWDSVLHEPLEVNRMERKTLDVMWEIINRNKKPFLSYMKHKAHLLGIKKLSWYDVTTPLGKTSAIIPYDNAAEFIIEQFNQFNPQMAQLAQMAFKNRWIEVEDRGDKLPGGFCTGFPLSKESRIFMTYSGSQENIVTLAHELGHAYHNHLIFNLPELAQHYPMNLAETASIFAEQIVSDAALKQSKSHLERLALLDQKAQRSIVFFMNIQARFLFELEFYRERQNGFVPSDILCTLMENAQKQAFENTLAEYDPYFWASKLHFFTTSTPFYNFPYTFGYLFSLGLYARAREDAKNFRQKYDTLLLDTGRMTVEELARKHLDVDLTKPDFWQSAIDVAIEDVNLFFELQNERE